jgi:uncharacterized protein YecE (DUF72 family)
MRRGRVLVGTSGWIYPHWKGRFYPEGLAHARQLAWLATHFPSVEVNGTFYSLARPEAFARWRAEVPAGFVFALKGSRYITHMLKLRGVETALANFFAQGVLRLGAQLGPILWQLPPQLGFERERAERFVAALPRTLAEAERLARRHDARLTGRSLLRAPDGHERPLRHALEVRHAGWLEEEALLLLAAHDVALVTADTADHHPLSLERTASFAYVRLHGSQALYASQYRDDELDEWAALVAAWRARGSDVFVYFDNDNKAYAPADAGRLIARLDARRTRRSVSDHKEGNHGPIDREDRRGAQRAHPL